MMTRWRPVIGLAVATLAVGVTFQIAPGGTSTEAREVRHVDRVDTLTDADWWPWDRAVFSVLGQIASQDRIPSHIADWFDGGANTFIDAARHNTALINPSAYTTVSQRHAYYDLIGFLLEFDPETPGRVCAQSGIRAFDRRLCSHLRRDLPGAASWRLVADRLV